jgi:hypothetical protein
MAVSRALIESRFGGVAAPVLRLGAGAGRGLRRAARAAWPWLRVAGGLVPLAPLGICALTLLVLTAWLNGGEHPDLIVQILDLGGLAMLFVCFLLVLTTMGWLWLVKMPAAQGALVLEGGMPLRTGFRLGWLSRNPLVRIAISWEEFAAVRVELLPVAGAVEEQATAAARDYRDSILRCFTVSDVFGLTRLAMRRRFLQVVRCLPEVSAAPDFALPVQYQPGDQFGHPEGQPVGDFVEMRRYAAGDPLKLILWKAYARTGKVLVRAPERAVIATKRTLAYLVAGPGDEPSAGIARSALASHALGTEVTFSADGAPHPAATPSEAIDQILFSARQGHNGGADLDRFLGQGESAGTAACVLFLPCRQGAWLADTVAALRAHQGPFQAVVGLDGPPLPDQRWPWWLRLLVRPSAGERPRAGEIRGICDALREAACEVVVMERHSGQVSRQDHLEG